MAEPQTADTMPSADTIKAWMDSNPDKAGTQDFVTMKQAYDAITAAPPNANTAGPRAAPPSVPLPPTPAVDPNTTMPGPRVGKDPRLMQPVAPNIDYKAPIADVRTALAAEPNAPSRQAGWERWADFEEQKQNQQGGMLRGANDWIRAIAQGIPGGAWGDEVNATVQSALPEVLGGRPYNEAVALEQARNKRFAYEHPVANPLLNIGGAVMAAPVTSIKGAGIAANTGIDTLISFIQGAGEANNGTLMDRAKAGGVDAAITAPLSLALNSAISSISKYGKLSPEIVRAAEALGIDRYIPAFVKAASPDIQASGRRYAQASLNSPLNAAWKSTEGATNKAAAEAANLASGTTQVMQAPTEVGRQLVPVLRASADAAKAERGVLARQTEELLPAGVRYDVPQMRANADEIVERNVGKHAVNPEAGLGDQLNMTRQPAPDPMNGPFAHYGPGGTTWPGLADAATEIGKTIKRPDVATERSVDKGQLAYIMSGLRDDQRSIMRRDAGPWAEATFEKNLGESSRLTDVRSAIKTAMGEKPEDVVNLALRAATIKGGGTNADALMHVTNALPPEQRVMLGGGVLAKIINDAGGSPQRMSSALESMTPEARSLLFPPGTQLAADVDALRTVSQRVGAVNEFKGTGSAASLGEKMAIAGKYGGGLGGATGLGYLAYQSGYGSEAAGLAGAAAAGRYGFNKYAKPYLLRAGTNPAIEIGMDAARGLSRGIGTKYQLPNSPPEQ